MRNLSCDIRTFIRPDSLLGNEFLLIWMSIYEVNLYFDLVLICSNSLSFQGLEPDIDVMLDAVEIANKVRIEDRKFTFLF